MSSAEEFSPGTSSVHTLALSDLVDNRTLALPMSQVEESILRGPGVWRVQQGTTVKNIRSKMITAVQTALWTIRADFTIAPALRCVMLNAALQ